MKHKGKKTAVLSVLTGVLGLFLLLFSLQIFWAHHNWLDPCSEEELPIEQILCKQILDEGDYRLLFLQTGLGKLSIDSIRRENGDAKTKILSYQDEFLGPRILRCTPLLGWFTREDILVNQGGQKGKGPSFASIQPGDILVSLSTHSLGWEHGHAALVLDEKTALETLALGQNSVMSSVDSWRKYSNYAVLRVKETTPELQISVAEYAKQNLNDIPYRLLSGLFQDKAMNVESSFFGAQCAYLVWYAWEAFGFDLDGDGGRLVTPMDILRSDKVELVQMYGLNPAQFS